MALHGIFGRIARKQEASSVSTGEPSATAPTRSSKRSWRGFVWDLWLYFVIYVVVSGVTIGPFFWVWFGAIYVDGPKWFARLYLPLAYLCEYCPPLRWVVNAWVNWWIL